jgi:hypothetical protein
MADEQCSCFICRARSCLICIFHNTACVTDDWGGWHGACTTNIHNPDEFLSGCGGHSENQGDTPLRRSRSNRNRCDRRQRRLYSMGSWRNHQKEKQERQRMIIKNTSYYNYCLVIYLLLLYLLVAPSSL